MRSRIKNFLLLRPSQIGPLVCIIDGGGGGGIIEVKVFDTTSQTAVQLGRTNVNSEHQYVILIFLTKL